jgi:hypothetical protein
VFQQINATCQLPQQAAPYTITIVLTYSASHTLKWTGKRECVSGIHAKIELGSWMKMVPAKSALTIQQVKTTNVKMFATQTQV